MIKRRFLVLAVLVAGAAAQWQGAPWFPDSDVNASADGTKPSAAAKRWQGVRGPSLDEVEREMILDLVRRHRPGTRDDWQQALADAVFTSSRQAGIDPLMVAAIVAKESSFRTKVVSHAGAVGLMQIRPFVARDVVERSGALEWNGVETLHDPEHNVRLGILYYQELVERFDGDEEAALAAYNRGPTRVRREQRSGSYRPGSYPRRVLGLYRELDAQRSGTSAPGSLG